ncbi:MAG TPA: NUDIX domain-containing protein [Vicinamibacterales bacterium]|nr:NUDIX domain-containing protein [Vicinamibacterales bacterium]
MSQYSHAGGVVVRVVDGQREYLLVEASRVPGLWVLPKGHIEAGETAEAAAVREVEEEAGVCASIIARAGDSAYAVNGKPVRTIFFVMRYLAEARAAEERARAWHRYEDALRIIRFDNLRRVLVQAHAVTETP